MARMLPVPVTALPRVQDRMSFLYLEHCVVHRQSPPPPWWLSSSARERRSVIRR